MTSPLEKKQLDRDGKDRKKDESNPSETQINVRLHATPLTLGDVEHGSDHDDNVIALDKSDWHRPE